MVSALVLILVALVMLADGRLEFLVPGLPTGLPGFIRPPSYYRMIEPPVAALNETIKRLGPHPAPNGKGPPVTSQPSKGHVIIW